MLKPTKLHICMAAAFGGLAVLPQLAVAQATTQLGRVEVTGSAVRRVDAESALSLQVLTKEDVARTGVTSTEALLQGISALSSAGGINNSTGAGSSTYGNSTLSLRGLESSRTLVLVNGRRLATFASGSSAVNVNVIPLSAIERVEILKDGASSIYGSDAMAGVVNFILAKSFDGVEVGLTTGRPTQAGGGDNRRFTLTAGFGDDTSPIKGVMSASIEKENPLFALDRDFSKTGNNRPFYTAGATGQGNIEGAVIPGAFPNDRVPANAAIGYKGFGASPGSGYGNPLADQGKCDTIKMFLNIPGTTKGAPYCTFDSATAVGLVPERELVNLTGNLSYKLNNYAELFTDLMYSKSTVIQTYQASPARRSFAVTNNRLVVEKVDPSLIMYPTNPNYPTAYLQKYAPGILLAGPNGGPAPIAITSRVMDFGGRQQTDVAIQQRMVAGVRGTISNQDYEVALMTNRSSLAGMYTGGVFSITDYNRIINDPKSDWNPWAPGGVQTGALATALKTSQYIGPSLDAVSKNQGLDAKLSGELFTLPAGPALYAVGLQQRNDNLSRTPAPKPGSGDISGAGGAAFAIDKSRDVAGLFGELNLPILQGLEASLSARTDKYSDFGTANTYKVSGRWQPLKEVVLRASYNTGFRAPTLPELYQPQVLGATEQFNDNGPNGTGATSLQVNGLTGGNPNLRPETSKAKSIGFVIAPIQNLSVGMDYFQIVIDDIIQTPGAQEVVSKFRAGDPAYQSLVKLNGRDIDTVITLTSNLGTADVAGVDLFANYRASFDSGRLDLGFNGTLMSKFDQTSPSGRISQKVGTIVEDDGTPVIGADGGGVILKWKYALSGTWTSGAWATTITQNFSDGYRTGNRVVDDVANYMPALRLYDLNVVYRGIKNTRLALGVKNLLDTVPGAPFVQVANQFQAGYDISQFDPRGRFVYVSGSYKF